jgi:copper chaperone CopZ
VGRVERALKKVPGVQEAVVNLATEKASLTVADPAQAAAILPQAVAAIEKAGYAVPAQSVDLQVGGMTCASCVGRGACAQESARCAECRGESCDRACQRATAGQRDGGQLDCGD